MVLILAFSVSALSKDDVFLALIENDASKKEAEFLIDNPTTLTKENFDFEFIEDYGRVLSYDIFAWQNCRKTRPNPIYENREVCTETNITHTKPVCSFQDVYIRTDTEVYYEYDFCPITELTTGQKTIKLDNLKIELERTPTGFGYAIDWQPIINVLGTDYKNQDWAWLNTSYEKCRNLTINNPSGSTLNNYPVLINLTKDDDMAADYSDILFSSEPCFNDGIEYDYEIENYTTNRALVWVKLENYTAGNNIISIYYDNDDALDRQDSAAVWSNNYQLVAHFNDNTDSTGNYTLTESGHTIGHYRQSVIGNGFQGNDAAYFNVSSFDGWSNFASISIEFILNGFEDDDDGVDEHFFWANNNNNYCRNDDTDATDLDFHFSGEWVYFDRINEIVPQYLGVSAEAGQSNSDGYINASLEAENQAQGTFDNSNFLWIAAGNNGANKFHYQMDEFRISTTHRSAAYYNATYEIIFRNDELVTLGLEEEIEGNTAPVIYNATIIPQSPQTNNNLNCSSIALDNESINLTYYFYWEKDGTLQEDFNASINGFNNTIIFTSELVNSGNLTAGDNWTCYTKAYDDDDYSNLINDSVNIAAVPPTPPANGSFNCQYNTEPNIKILNKIKWLCSINCSINCTSYKCYTYVKNGADIIQTNPKQEFIQDVGMIDYYQAQPENTNYQFVSVYFTTEDLRDDQALEFSVACAGDDRVLTFSRNVTPQYKEPVEIADLTLWLKDYGYYLIGGLFVLLFIIFFVSMLWGRQ